MIKTENVIKTFDGFAALDGLTLNVPKGSVYGMVGPNGAGKSTIIRHIVGIYKQDSGTILVDGENPYENESIKSRIAYIPDDVFHFPQSSVNEMMSFYKSVYKKFDKDRFDKLADIFEIDPKKPIRRLSKGMQKQAAFWLMLSLRPDVLVLDEPVDGLDPVMRRQVWSLIMSEVAENGTTVLISSHNLRELEDVCDRVGIMNHGKMMTERSLSDLQENICKIQLALPDDVQLPNDLDIVHGTQNGRLQILIVRGKPEELTDRLSEIKPLFMDIVPLTLEEIFIYELGGEDYGVKEIIL